MMSVADKVKYGFCQCFLERNVFIPLWQKHVEVTNDIKQFQEKYFNKNDKKKVFDEMQKEVERRKNFHQNLKSLRQEIKLNYEPKHPEIFRLDSNRFLHPDFLKLANNSSSTLDEVKSLKFYKQNSCSFPVFTEEFCNLLREEVANFQSTSLPRNRPNTMNEKGLILDDIGFGSLVDQLRTEFVNPISKRILHTDFELDSHRAFTVFYDSGDGIQKSGLYTHFDNAEVTLNVCLSPDSEFEGGDLEFDGMSYEEESNPDNRFGYSHEQGRGLLHFGCHIHKALPLSKGQRTNLVIWMRSSKERNQICPMCNKKPRIIEVEEGYGDGFTLNE